MTSFQHNTGSRWTDRQTPFDSKYHAYRADKKQCPTTTKIFSTALVAHSTICTATSHRE